jgi:hypothetical protein
VKIIRLLGTFVCVVAALAGVLAAVALVPAVQTWVAQSALARQPGLKATLGSVTAGFGEADVEDLRLEFGGAVLTVPSLKAKLPITTAVLGRRLVVRRLAAKGWTLDLRKASVPAAPAKAGSPPAGAAPAGPAAAGLPPGEAAATVQAAARAFRGILNEWQLPPGGSLDGVALEGDVLLPAAPGRESASVHVVLTGGGLSGGHDGAFPFVATGDAGDAAHGWTSFSAHGDITVALRSPRSAGRIGVKADVSAKRGSVEESLNVAVAVAAAGPTEEAYTLEIGRGGRRLVALEASLAGAAQSLSGTWRLDLRDSDLGAFAGGGALPNFSVSGDGRFEADTPFSRVRAQGSLSGMAGHLGVLAAPLEGLGTVAFDGRFDVVHSGHSLRFGSLKVSLGEAHPAAVVQSLQAFEIDEGTGGLSLSEPRADWLDVLVPGFPMAWISGMAAGPTFTGGDVTGELRVAAAGSGYALRAKSPLCAAGVSILGAGGALARGLDLSLTPVVQLGRHDWQLRLAPLEVACGGHHLARVEAGATEAPGNAQAIAIKGTWSADLEAIAAQKAAPAFPWIGGRSASGEFSATLGGTTDFEATLSAAGRDPARTLSASVKATVDPDGSMAFLVPVKIAFGKEVTEVSAEGSWNGGSPAAGGSVTLTGGKVSLEQLRLLGGPLAAAGGVLGPADGVATAAAGARGRAPFWGSWTGSVAFTFEALSAGDHEFSDVGGTIEIEPAALRLEGGRGGIDHHSLTKVEGTVSFDAAANLPYQVKATTALATEIDAAKLFPAHESGQLALLEGRFSLSGEITGSGASLDDLMERSEAKFRLASTTGVLRLLQTSVAESIPEASTPVKDSLDTVGSAVGAFFGHHEDFMNAGKNTLSKNAEAVMSFTNEVAEIGCDTITVDAVRGGDGAVRLVAIEVKAHDEHITGTGKISYERGTPLFREPLSIDLQFGARGRAAELLTKAGLLSPRKDALGYSLIGEPIHLGGTLERIDTGPWHQLLVEAATRKPDPGK